MALPSRLQPNSPTRSPRRDLRQYAFESAISETEEDAELPAPVLSRELQTSPSQRRRSSVAQKWDSLKRKGGPNSIENFSRSFQRAANFREIAPGRRASYVVQPAEEEPEDYFGRGSQLGPRKSLLSQQLSHSVLAQSPALPIAATEPTESSALLSTAPSNLRRVSTPRSRRTPSDTNLGTSYGSISSRLTPDAQRRASILADTQLRAANRARENSKEYEIDNQRHLEVHEEDGEEVMRVVGHSTVPMTIFNTVNALVGVGLLALPLAMSHSGWLVGIVLFTAIALVTQYTALLLARCLDTNTGSMTYGDIAYLAFGKWGRMLVEIIFLIELLVAGVSMIILFADSMHSLVPAVSVVVWQVIVALGLLPLNFVPFRYLSITSVLGIFCTIGILVMVFTDGFVKPDQPGSLRQVAHTDILPNNIRAVPLSIGLLMAPWGGHAVIPAIYRDMRHPKKFIRAMRISYGSSYVIDITMAVIGYLMFGNGVHEEVTTGILKSNYYPAALSLIIIFLIALVPTTKIPLTNRPIMDTIAGKFEPDLDNDDDSPTRENIPNRNTTKGKVARYSTAILSNVVQLGIAIAFPSFDSVIGLLGSAFCCTICIILPIVFYLRIFSKGGMGISLLERMVCWMLIVLSALMAVIGTVWAIMPRERLGIDQIGKVMGN